MNIDPEDNKVSSRRQLPCPLCGDQLSFRIAKGRKSNKPFIMVICPRDGRHFRGFIGDRNYVRQVLNQMETGRIGERV